MTERERTKNYAEKSSSSFEHCFDHKSPRPPVPGGERPSHYEKSSSSKCYENEPTQNNVYEYELATTSWTSTSVSTMKVEDPRLPHSDSCSSLDNPSPPMCLRWTVSLHCLLQDAIGVKLYLKYLKSESPLHEDALKFWFACEGMRNQHEKEKIQQCVKVIYRTFFVKSTLPISEELKKTITKKMKSIHSFEPPVTIFDEAQAQLEHLMKNTTYPNFFKSDIYLQHFQSVQNPSNGSVDFSEESSSSSSVRDLTNIASAAGPLPTLHEDIEYVNQIPHQRVHTPGTNTSTGYHTPNPPPVRLTKDVLLMSEKHRLLDIRPKSEEYAGLFMHRHMGAHAAYNSYNPVSRQDSEMQSLSSHSDNRTDHDSMSLTNSSVDGWPKGRSIRRQAVLDERHIQDLASLNKDSSLIMVPRMGRQSEWRQPPPKDPRKLAKILTEKLEALLNEQRSQEMFVRKLKEGDSTSSLDKTKMNDLQSRAINTFKEKLQLEDDNDQDILDQHVSRVFSDLTPTLSPNVSSPRPHSPPPRKRSSSRKTLNDPDSGVSMYSDTPPVLPPLPQKDNRVLSWVMKDMDRMSHGPNHTHSEMSSKHRSSHRSNQVTSPTANHHRKGYGTRVVSSEKNCILGGVVVPQHPLMTDPSIPLPTAPDTTNQLEGVVKKLMDTDFRSKPKQRSSNKYCTDFSQSNQSTLRKSGREMKAPLPLPQGPPPSEEHMTAIVSFSDEHVPYRLKIPGSQITFRQFKENLPKKGNYRYFFKTICEDLDNQVIQEEVNRDMDVLPLFEGKIMAQVKPID